MTKSMYKKHSLRYEEKQKLYDAIDRLQIKYDANTENGNSSNKVPRPSESKALQHLNPNPLQQLGEHEWFVDIFPNDDNYYDNLLISEILKSKNLVEKWFEGCKPELSSETDDFLSLLGKQLPLRNSGNYGLVVALNQTNLLRTKRSRFLNSPDSEIWDPLGMIGIMYEEGKTLRANRRGAKKDIKQIFYIPPRNPFKRKYKEGKHFNYDSCRCSSSGSRVRSIIVANPFFS